MINLFSKNIPPDAADGRDEVKLMVKITFVVVDSSISQSNCSCALELPHIRRFTP